MTVRVGGLLRLDLRGLDDDAMHRKASAIEYAPDGAQVHLVVDPGQFYTGAAVDVLRQHAPRVQLTVECDGDVRTISVWVGVLERGVPEW